MNRGEKMKFWIGVENFAKIESAKICIDNYTVLVGPNNSGKTFLMQLVQGLSKRLAYLLDEIVMEELLKKDYDAYKEFVINSDNVSALTSCMNKRLAEDKEIIMREIFGKDIYAERIYVEAIMEEESSYSIILFDAIRRTEIDDIASFLHHISPKVVSMVNRKNAGMIAIINQTGNDERKNQTLSVHWSSANYEDMMLKSALQSIMESESLFLPASRTGLLLLYRDFFANRTDNDLSFVFEGERFVDNQEKTATLTKPMYDFLRFLQTYSERKDINEKYRDELKFFEKHLIEGHIDVNEQGIFSYRSADENATVPMYLASSMIKEITPFVLAVMSNNMYNRLIIDEVEASLHPQKQLELVRFLNRLNNMGMKLIVSTHSDTFASKLSNLYILSERVKVYGEEILEKFKLENADLIEPEKLFVYEFVMQPNGKSIVKRILGDKKTGFQFDAFTDSALHLYEEGTKLGEIQ